MKIKLKTNFRDYYDHWFCGSHDTPEYVFERMNRNNLSRTDQFLFLKNTLNLNVPRFGIISELKYFLPSQDVVVYLDEYAHCGEGKIKMSYNEALEQYPDKLVSQYIKPRGNNAVSIRHLQIGMLAFAIRYTGYNSWMSNNADIVDIEVLSTLKPFYNVPHPLFAIDYVCGLEMAVDFNTSPQIKNTGLENIISSEGIYKAIESQII